MHAKSSTSKKIKIPGPDHPITISPAEGKVRVTVAGKILAESAQASARGEGVSACLLFAPQRRRHVVARSDHALHVLSVQG
jgi:uncharacterized protein (DUF427 family)